MFYANFDGSGNIIGYYDDEIHENIPEPNISLTDDEWHDCVSNIGLRRVDVATKKVIVFTPQPPSIEVLREGKNKEIDSAVEAAILAGFYSSALGSAHFYPAGRDSQTNLIGAVSTSVDMTFPCRDGAGNWARVMHPAADLKQVLVDGAIRKQALLSHADTLRDAVAAGTDMDAVVVDFSGV